jgi:hypothetical protein
MKTFRLSTLLAVLEATLAFSARVNYDGSKAVRIAVGDDITAVKNLIETLSLPTWKGVVNGIPMPNALIDVVVPAHSVAAFEELSTGLNTEVMHEDLGLAIAAEGEFSAYASEWKFIYGVYQKTTDIVNSWQC